MSTAAESFPDIPIGGARLLFAVVRSHKHPLLGLGKKMVPTGRNTVCRAVCAWRSLHRSPPRKAFGAHCGIERRAEPREARIITLSSGFSDVFESRSQRRPSARHRVSG